MASKEVKDALDMFREAQASVSKPAAVPKPEHKTATTDFLAKILERIQQHELKKKVVRDYARAEFARATSKDPYERHTYHRSLKDRRYSEEMLQGSQNALREQWDMAAKENRLPTEFITSPDQVQHSAVAAEYMARITALPPELRNDPRVLYAEASRAYQSINWNDLTPDEELELKLVIDKTFARMHELARTEKVPGVSDTDEELWWGMGDYYLSRDISPEEVQPDPANPDKQIETRNRQRRNLKDRLKRLQSDLSQYNAASEEKKHLEDASRDIQKGKYETERRTKKGPVKQPPLYLEEDAERVRRHLSREIGDFDTTRRPDSRINPDREPTAVRLEDLRAEADEQAERHRNQPQAYNLFQDLITPEAIGEKFAGQENLQQQLLELRSRFDISPRSHLKGYESDVLGTGQQLVRDMLRERNLSAGQKEFLKTIDQRLESEMARKRQMEQPMSRFYLTPIEIASLDEDPIGTIDTMISKVMGKMMYDPEDLRVRSTMDRMDLMNQYLFSEQYDAKRAYDFMLENDMQPADAKKVVDILSRFSDEQKDRLSRTFTIRWHAVRWFREWSNTDSPSGRKFSEFINERMNEDDFFGLDGIYGPLVARAREILRAKYEKYLYKDGLRQGHNPQWYQFAQEETIAELIQNKEYEDIYKNQYLQGKFFMANPDASQTFGDPDFERNTLIPTNPHGQKWEDAAKTITDFANIRFLMSGEKFNMDIRFETPRYGVMAGQLPSTFHEKQRIAKLMRPFTHHFMTWEGFAGKPAIERAIMRHRANIMRHASPEIDAWAKEWTDRVWKDVTRWKDGGMDEGERKQLFAEVGSRFFFQPDKLKRPPDPTKNNGDEFAHWLSRLSRKTLEEEARVYSGMLIDQQHTMRPYLMMFESGYRNGAEREFMKELVNTLYPDPDAHEGQHIFLAGHVVDRANGYFMKKYTGDPEESRKKFVSAMKEASRYRPHSMAMVLREGESRLFAEYVERVLPGGKKEYSNTFAQLSIRFDEIRARILEQFDTEYTQIDYLQGPVTDQQRQVVDAVFAAHANDRDAMTKETYLGIMKQLSQNLTREHGWAEEFSNIRYAPLLSKGRWDDYPYEWLQYPERFVNKLRAKYPERISDETYRLMMTRASERFIGLTIGEEQSGPFRRMWRDLGAAQMVFDQMQKFFDPDPKVHSEAFQTAYGYEVGYQGTMHAAMNVVMAAGGLEGAEKVYGFFKKGFGPFRESAKGSNDFSVYGFSDHKGKSVDELRESIEHVLRMTSGNVAHNAGDEAAALLESAEEYLGISNYRTILLGDRNSTRTKALMRLGKMAGYTEEEVEGRIDRILDIMNDRYPIGIIAFRGEMALPYVLLLLAMVVAKEVQRGGKEESHH